MVRISAPLTISLALLTSNAAAKLLEAKDVPKFQIMSTNDYSAFAKDIAEDYPHGKMPNYNYKAPELEKDSLKSIEFYTMPGCTGGGSATRVIPRKVLVGNDKAKTCNAEIIEESGASFIIDGEMGPNCQFHFYKAPGCSDDNGNHLGFITAAQQTKGCMQLYDSQGKVVSGVQAVSYVCDPDA